MTYLPTPVPITAPIYRQGRPGGTACALNGFRLPQGREVKQEASEGRVGRQYSFTMYKDALLWSVVICIVTRLALWKSGSGSATPANATGEFLMLSHSQSAWTVP